MLLLIYWSGYLTGSRKPRPKQLFLGLGVVMRSARPSGRARIDRGRQ